MRRLTTAPRAFLLLVALAATAGTATPANAATPIPAAPLVSLETMSKSPVSIEAGDFASDRAFETATRTFEFTLPRGTVPEDTVSTWFLLDLSYRITFAADSAAGFAWVSAATNDATAAQVEYELIAESARASGASLSVRESTVTLVDGQEERELDGLSSELHYANYARENGVRDGDNTFSLRVEHTDGVKIERIAFLSNTGVSTTEITPYPLGLTVEGPDGAVHVGDTFQILVTLENRTGAELGNVTLEAFSTDKVARAVDDNVLQLGPLIERQQHRLAFEAIRSGPTQISVLGGSQRNQPAATVELIVLPRSANRAGVLALLALAGASPIALGGAIVALRARRRRARPRQAP